MQTPLRKLKVQRDSLVATTAALVEAIRTAEGGLGEAPKGLRREDLAVRVGGQKRAGSVPRGDTQRKQDGRQEKPKQQEPVWTEKPTKKVGGRGPGKIQKEQQIGVKIHNKKPSSEYARSPPSKEREIDPGKKVQESTAGSTSTGTKGERGGEAPRGSRSAGEETLRVKEQKTRKRGRQQANVFHEHSKPRPEHPEHPDNTTQETTRASKEKSQNPTITQRKQGHVPAVPNPMAFGSSVGGAPRNTQTHKIGVGMKRNRTRTHTWQPRAISN